jgi:hypothetical protein
MACRKPCTWAQQEDSCTSWCPRCDGELGDGQPQPTEPRDPEADQQQNKQTTGRKPKEEGPGVRREGANKTQTDVTSKTASGEATLETRGRLQTQIKCTSSRRRGNKQPAKHETTHTNRQTCERTAAKSNEEQTAEQPTTNTRRYHDAPHRGIEGESTILFIKVVGRVDCKAVGLRVVYEAKPYLQI